MADTELNAKLQALLVEVVDELRLRVKSGGAKPADIANAIKLLQSHGIQADTTNPKSPLFGLVDSLKELPYQ